MNYLAAMLLLHSSSPCEAFVALANLLHGSRPIQLYVYIIYIYIQLYIIERGPSSPYIYIYMHSIIYNRERAFVALAHLFHGSRPIS